VLPDEYFQLQVTVKEARRCFKEEGSEGKIGRKLKLKHRQY
jgi:hypothetical protein